MRRSIEFIINHFTKASPIDFHGVSLDDDVLTEILARLPAKSVIRFKLVCKSWLSLISSEHFRRLRALCKPPISLTLTTLNSGPRSAKQIIEISELFYSNQIIKRSNEKQRIIIPSDICLDDNVIPLRHCNGILLLRNKYGECYVYNSVTNHSEKIVIRGYNLHVRSLFLVCDPLKSLHNYKVVCIRGDEPLILAFNSVGRRWSVCEEGFTNGKSLMYVIHESLLYCFNFNVKNVLQFIVCPLPTLVDQGQVYYDILQESNGCLYYCAFVSCFSLKSAAALWELQVNGGDPRSSEWLLKYCHSVHHLPILGVSMFAFHSLPILGVSMLAFIRETSTVLILDCGKVMAYSFVDKSYRELLHLEPFSTRARYYVHVNRLP